MIHPSGFWVPSCSSTRLPRVSHGGVLLLKQKFTFKMADFHKAPAGLHSLTYPQRSRSFPCICVFDLLPHVKTIRRGTVSSLPTALRFVPEQIIHDTPEPNARCRSPATRCKVQQSGLGRYSAPLFTVPTASHSERTRGCREEPGGASDEPGVLMIRNGTPGGLVALDGGAGGETESWNLSETSRGSSPRRPVGVRGGAF